MNNFRVTVKPALLERYQQYASMFGQSTEQAISEALTDWFETFGEGRMECAAEKAAKV